MKTAQLAMRMESLLPLLRCPRCGASFRLTEQSLVCGNGHCYDLSRRGYVNLAPAHDQASERYDAPLFESRRLVLEAGFYTPVLDAVCALLPGDCPFSLLDVGCGEGYYARRIAERFPVASVVGLDLSRDAITAAARMAGKARWIVADLKHLPIADASVDVLLDVLTPAAYDEFARVLKRDGRLIKVVPGVDYLREIREAVSPWLRGGADYDNARVLKHFRAHAQLEQETEIRAVTPLTPELSRAFLRMTPMTFSVPEEALDALSVPAVTLHMHVLMARMDA